MPDPASLETILDRSHAALLAADLTALTELAPEIEAALAMVDPADSALAARLALKAERNSKLLEAAMMGVRSARRRAADLTDAGRFSTYDAGGQRGQPGLAPPLAARRL